MNILASIIQMLFLAMDRGEVVGGESTAKKVLSNNVIKDVKAVKMIKYIN